MESSDITNTHIASSSNGVSIDPLSDWFNQHYDLFKKNIDISKEDLINQALESSNQLPVKNFGLPLGQPLNVDYELDTANATASSSSLNANAPSITFNDSSSSLNAPSNTFNASSSTFNASNSSFGASSSTSPSSSMVPSASNAAGDEVEDGSPYSYSIMFPNLFSGEDKRVVSRSTMIQCEWDGCQDTCRAEELWNHHIADEAGPHWKGISRPSLREIKCLWADCQRRVQMRSLKKHIEDMHLQFYRVECVYCHHTARKDVYSKYHGHARDCRQRQTSIRYAPYQPRTKKDIPVSSTLLRRSSRLRSKLAATPPKSSPLDPDLVSASRVPRISSFSRVIHDNNLDRNAGASAPTNPPTPDVLPLGNLDGDQPQYPTFTFDLDAYPQLSDLEAFFQRSIPPAPARPSNGKATALPSLPSLEMQQPHDAQPEASSSGSTNAALYHEDEDIPGMAEYLRSLEASNDAFVDGPALREDVAMTTDQPMPGQYFNVDGLIPDGTLVDDLTANLGMYFSMPDDEAFVYPPPTDTRPMAQQSEPESAQPLVLNQETSNSRAPAEKVVDEAFLQWLWEGSPPTEPVGDLPSQEMLDDPFLSQMRAFFENGM